MMQATQKINRQTSDPKTPTFVKEQALKKSREISKPYLDQIKVIDDLLKKL